MSTQQSTGEGTPLQLFMVAYYFPPSGGAGVQRILKWVKYLPQFGVEPVVLTVQNGAYPEIDETLLDEIPEGVEVVRTRAADPFSIYGRITGKSRAEVVAHHTDEVGKGGRLVDRTSRWIRANMFVPDARVGWWPFAVARGLAIARKRRVDIVLSTGPPHSTHLIGRSISRMTRRPWVADFRDPWTNIHYYQDLPRGRAAAYLDARLERGVLRSADAVTTVSPSWAELLGAKANRSVITLPNGFDPEDFASKSPPSDPSRFVIAHVGSLYSSRNPQALWLALAALGGDAGSVSVRVVGRVGKDVLRSAAMHGIEVESTGYVNHAEAVAEMRRADVLLLSAEPQAEESGHIPGKLFEYLASGRPVLGLGNQIGDAARIVDSTGAGKMFARDDVAGVESWLRRCHDRWSAGETLSGARSEAIDEFSRIRQSARLAEILHDVLGR